jgi:hypothetical protein
MGAQVKFRHARLRLCCRSHMWRIWVAAIRTYSLWSSGVSTGGKQKVVQMSAYRKGFNEVFDEQ